MPTSQEIRIAGAAVLAAGPLLESLRFAVANSERLQQELAARNHQLLVLPEEQMGEALQQNALLLALLYQTATSDLPGTVAGLRAASDQLEALGAVLAPLIEGYEPPGVGGGDESAE